MDEEKSAKIEGNVKEEKAKSFKAKNATIEEITGALVKAANSKNKAKNTTIAEDLSYSDNAKSHEKGDKILEDLGLKKKKGLPLASAVARGEHPPCICPDKGKHKI